MPTSFYIQNPWTELVIDIGEKSELYADTKKTSAPGNAYQLWTFKQFIRTPVNTVIPYYFLVNANVNLANPLVINIIESGNVITSSPGGQRLQEGSRLNAHTEKSGQVGDLDDNHPACSNQVWSFSQDTASGHYFIANWLTKFVIDIEEGKLSSGQQPGPGTHLDAWSQKTKSPQNKNQLWQFVDANGASVTPPGITISQNIGGVGGSTGVKQ